MYNLGELENSKYMNVVIDQYESNKRKTPIYGIYDKAGWGLGSLKWYSPYRSYAFYPTQNSVFDETCLGIVSEWIIELNERYKLAKDSI